MQKLRTEYTDVKDVKHHVEHILLTEKEQRSRERIMEELYTALTRESRKIPA